MSACLPFEFWRKDWEVIRPRLKNLYYKGNIDLLTGEHPRLAIVGSRQMTDYGAKVIENWMADFVAAGIVIVSGFMYGVDQTAHKCCLDLGGKTTAVLGWGIDMKGGNIDIEIYQKILELDSLIVSEYEGERTAEKWTFPARDRLMAGMVDAVLVVEAAEKSGSLITAKYARSFGKKVLAVPGQVTSRVACGTNDLIKTGMAKMVTSANDVLGEMGVSFGQMALLSSKDEIDPVLSLILDNPRTADEINMILKMSMSDLLTKITELSLLGQIEERSGKYWPK